MEQFLHAHDEDGRTVIVNISNVNEFVGRETEQDGVVVVYNNGERRVVKDLTTGQIWHTINHAPTPTATALNRIYELLRARLR